MAPPDAYPAAGSQLWRWLTRAVLLLALLFLMRAARPVLLPIAMALALSFALSMPVRRLRETGVPEGLGAALVVAALLGSLVLLGILLGPPAADVLARAPAALQAAASRWRERWLDGALPEWIGMLAPDVPALLREAMREVFEAGLESAATLVLLYFMLASHRPLVGSAVQACGRRRTRARIVGGLQQAERDIGVFLRTMSLLNIGLGAATGIGLAALQLPHPLLWATLTAALCFIPYLGPAMVTVLLFGAGSLYYDAPLMALAPPLVFLGLHAIEANLLGPWLMGYSLGLHTLAVLIAVLVLGWAWGVGGGLLAVPLLLGARAAMRRHPRLRRYRAWLQRMPPGALALH